jgi:uncharacterized protein (DUF2267 family)
MNEDKFLREIETRAELNRAQAFNVATAVLQELHDRLTPREADELAAQLPGELRDRWHALDRSGREVRRTHKKDFVRHIAEVLEVDELRAGRALRACFKALQLVLKSPTGREGEAWDVFSQLPKDLKHVWMESATMPKHHAAKAPGARAGH